MSKKRRIRKHRSQWDRIEWRRKDCEDRIRRGRSCRHYFFCDRPEGFDKFAEFVLAKDNPTTMELRAIACARFWEVVRHPMTQLYKMVDPRWYEDQILRGYYCLGAKHEADAQSGDVTRRCKIDAEKFIRKAGLRSRARRAVSLAHFAANVGQPHFRMLSWIDCSIRRCLLLAKRFRAIARKNKAASLNDKYGRPSVSRTAAPSR